MLELILYLLTQPDHYWAESFILNIIGILLTIEEIVI
jgi:hypothetical protein